MDRFVAMLWDAKAEKQNRQVDVWSSRLQDASRDWVCAVNTSGLRVFAFSAASALPFITPFEGADGVVIGPLFKRGEEKKGRVASIPSPAASRIIATQGEELMQQYWGNYVAYWRQAEGPAVHSLRDPSGALPCLRMQREGIEVHCSYVSDIAHLMGRPTIDWNYLRAFLIYNYFATCHTGLVELTEVLAGQRLLFRPGRDPEFTWAWNAVEFAATPARMTLESAQALVRITVESCFTAWSASPRGIMVQLSGGLDSSIAAALLRRLASAQVTGLHLVAGGYEAYELELARFLASHAGMPLVEVPITPADVDLHSILGTPRLARPSKQIIATHVRNVLQRVCEDEGATCLASGHGGDALFLQRAVTPHTLTDYVRLEGFGKEFWRIAYETAMLQEQSVWSMLALLHRGSKRSYRWRPYGFLDNAAPRRHRLMTAESVNTIPDSYRLHPWLEQATGLPPGKADQLSAMLMLYNYYAVGVDGTRFEQRMPFLSQPIMELCLRLPTYMFMRGGTDRALERAAFSDIVPSRIFERTAKGYVDHHLLSVTRRNIDFLREFVLDGEIVQQDWIDREEVERILTPEHLLSGRGMDGAYSLVAAEAWLNAWRRR